MVTTPPTTANTEILWLYFFLPFENVTNYGDVNQERREFGVLQDSEILTVIKLLFIIIIVLLLMYVLIDPVQNYLFMKQAEWSLIFLLSPPIHIVLF